MMGHSNTVPLVSNNDKDEDINKSILNHEKIRAKAKELFDDMGRYIIEDYDALPTFSNFLPGVAGIFGKPVWSFYVNRGQGIASFGVKSKDYPIMEYHSANNAYENTAFLGFRTFYQGRRDGGWGKSDESWIIEPFDPARTRFSQFTSTDEGNSYPMRSMFIGSNEMQIREVDNVHKIETNVTYFVLPEEQFGAFVRRTTISNIDKQRSVHLSILDGLARIQPVGGKMNQLLKNIGRTLEGWMGVYSANHNTMPFFRLSTEPTDSAAVVVEESGHFVLSYIENEEKDLLPIVYDTNKVFGHDSSLMRPVGLYDKTVEDILDGEQYGFAKTSSAFAAVKDVTIYAGQSITIVSYYGRGDKITDVPVIARRITQGGFAQYKLSRARELIKQITRDVRTDTSNLLFNAYVEQMYLDNSLRGGVPVLLGDIDDKSQSLSADEDTRIKVYHLFSRIHGDLERDYNDFEIEPTFFSEGPGNFRDVAQNRRNDVIINPRVGSHNVRTFLSFIQADGYNPLSVEAVVFTIESVEECNRLASVAVGYADGHRADREALAAVLCAGGFRPGQLAELIQSQNIFLMTELTDLIDNVAASAKVHPMAVTKDGYWGDHFTYLMDLLESYEKIYPDRMETLYDAKLQYYFSSMVTLPRHQKYVLSLSYDGKGYHVRQLNPSVDSPSRRNQMRRFKNNMTGWLRIESHYQHDARGEIFKSTPIAKLFLLGTVKFATRDAYGMGIEYEGGKPGWNDAMNGLVGMLGSGMPETFELKVLLEYIRKATQKYDRPIIVPFELATLIDNITAALDELGDDEYMPSEPITSNDLKVPPKLFTYWDTVASAREDYRSTTTTFSGETIEYSPKTLVAMIDRWIGQIDLGIARSLAIGSYGDDEGVPPTYFSYNVTKWKETGKKNEEGHKFVSATELYVWKFPLFLEGPVRMMKVVDKERATSIYNAVKDSGLRDDTLKMYTLSASLVGQSFDMGRMMAFSPGWLENQSVWMHMSYKYYLELLRKGMYEEFFSEMQTGMLPFINSEKYGRSLLECSSFIASSAFADPEMVGQGFLARLSGSTSEFLSMWVIMMIGTEPFFLRDQSGALEMQLKPAIPFWLFRKHDEDTTLVSEEQQYSISFKLFTSIDVTYYLREARDLFGISPSRYEIGLRDGSKVQFDSPTIPTEFAMKIRRVVFIDYIHAYFTY